MNSFVVIRKAKEDDLRERYPTISRISFINKLLYPYKSEDIILNDVTAAEIKIPDGFERIKLKRSCKFGYEQYGYIVSKDYNINFNLYFYHSCLIRALDYYTVSLGCDLRLGEVAIADASTLEGRNSFFLLLPFARRIVLVSKKKQELIPDVEYAILKYGTSVAIIEDPIRASENADAIILSSKDENYKYLAEVKKPMLYFNFIYPPKSSLWFNDVDIAFNDNKMDITFAQGYLQIKQRKIIWSMAEKEGFLIKSIRRDNEILIER